MTTHIRTVIIPAAGQGSRLLPLTKVVPKELLPVYDRPVLQYALDEAVAAGAERIVIVIHPSKMAIRNYFTTTAGAIVPPETASARARNESRAQIGVPPHIEVVFAIQKAPLGLGHAVLSAIGDILPGPVGVILPDDMIVGLPCMLQMAAAYQSGHMIAAMEVSPKDVEKYGIFRPAGSQNNRSVRVSGMVEKPKLNNAPSMLAAVGRYILDAAIFDTLARTPAGSGGEIQLTDAIAADGARHILTAFQFAGTRFDCGTFDGLFAAGAAQQSKSSASATAEPNFAAAGARPDIAGRIGENRPSA